MKLSKRLETVASFVAGGGSLADIGTDHGYIPIWLVLHGAVSRALAVDVRPGPLERAEEHIREYGLEDRIETRLSDGLRQLEPGEADCVVIAGMGGELLVRILEEGRHMWDSVRYWVLSPQSDLCQVRTYLTKQEFSIVRETMIKEDGKYYTVMGAVRREDTADESMAHYKYGRLLIRQRDPVLKEYLEQERRALLDVSAKLGSIDSERAGERRAEIEEELSWIGEAEDEMR